MCVCVCVCSTPRPAGAACSACRPFVVRAALLYHVLHPSAAPIGGTDVLSPGAAASDAPAGSALAFLGLPPAATALARLCSAHQQHEGATATTGAGMYGTQLLACALRWVRQLGGSSVAPRPFLRGVHSSDMLSLISLPEVAAFSSGRPRPRTQPQ